MPLATAARSGATPGRRARSRRATKTPVRAEKRDYPQAVVDAEAAATPGRRVRLAAAAVGGVAAVAQAGLQLATSDVNTITLVVDGGVAAGAWYFWQTELETREENLQRIMERAQARREELDADDVKERRAVKGFGGAKRTKSVVTSKTVTKTTTVRRVQKGAAADAPAAAPAEATGSRGGLLGGLKAAVDEANAVGRANAIALNNMLEDAGVVEPLAPASASSSPADDDDDDDDDEAGAEKDATRP